MPSVDELLLNGIDTLDDVEALEETNKYCEIDETGRVIVLNDLAEILGVENDKAVERVYFRCPRYVGDNVDLDLKQCTVYINFQNANMDKDQYIVTDLNTDETDSTKVTFSWLLSKKVTQYKGIVNFIVCARKTKTGGEIEQEWNTTLAKATVLEGLEPDPYVVPSDDMDVVNQLMDLVKQEIEQKGKETIDSIPDDYTALTNEVQKKFSFGGQIGDASGTEIEAQTIGSLDPRKSYTIWRNGWLALTDVSDGLRNAVGSPSYVYLGQAVVVDAYNSVNLTYSDVNYIVYVPIYVGGAVIMALWRQNHVLGKSYILARTDDTFSLEGHPADALEVGNRLEIVEPGIAAINMFYGQFIYDGYVDSNGDVTNAVAGFKSTPLIKIPKNIKKLFLVLPFQHQEYIAFFDENENLLASYNADSPIFDDGGTVIIEKAQHWAYVRYGVWEQSINYCALFFIDDGTVDSSYVLVQPEMTGIKNVARWNGSSETVVFTDDYVTITSDGTDVGSYGISTAPFCVQEQLKNPIVYVDLTINSGLLVLYIAGYKKSNGDPQYIAIKTYKESAREKRTIDLSYYNVYSDIDLTKELYFVISCNSENVTDTIVRTFQYDFDEFNGSDLPGGTLVETINNIQSELNQKADIGSVSSGSSDGVVVSPNGSKFVPVITDNGVVSYTPVVPEKTLFIGNSLLIGWGTFGMCAKDSSHDYYHYITEYVKTKKATATFDKISGTAFEGATSEETATTWMTETLSEKLSNDLDLVVIQLSDNVNTEEKTATFHSTCVQLIRYIRSICTKARVVWVSAWYYTTEKQTIIQEACADSGAIFINITDIASVSENKGAIGDVIHKDDGSTTVVDSSGVASHPGNRGMRLIANRILYSLGISDTEETYDDSYDG